MAVRFSVAIFVATAAAVVLRATPGTAERTNEKMDRSKNGISQGE